MRCPSVGLQLTEDDLEIVMVNGSRNDEMPERGIATLPAIIPAFLHLCVGMMRCPSVGLQLRVLRVFHEQRGRRNDEMPERGIATQSLQKRLHQLPQVGMMRCPSVGL